MKPIISFAEQFLEVACRSSGKLRRFAAGAEAGFALNLINRKLGAGTQPSLYIEAVKEGEEPVSFGPNSVLVNYGEGWKLQTVLAEGKSVLLVSVGRFYLKSWKNDLLA